MSLYKILFLIFISNSLLGQTEFTFVFLNKKSNAEELPKEKLDELMKGHLANIQRLAKEDKLIAAGPFDEGGGIFIFKSLKCAIRFFSSDPSIQFLW